MFKQKWMILVSYQGEKSVLFSAMFIFTVDFSIRINVKYSWKLIKFDTTF